MNEMDDKKQEIHPPVEEPSKGLGQQAEEPAKDLGQQAEEPADNYSFIKEVIKNKPIDKKKIGIAIGAIVAAAILFGIVAAFTFAKVLPHYTSKEAPPKVDIPADQDPAEEAKGGDTEVADQDSSVTDETKTAETPTVVPAEIKLVDYKKLYADMLQVAQEPKKAIVTVVGTTNQVDWFNQTYEKPGQQTSGLIVANNGQELFILTEYRIADNVDRIQVTFCNNVTVDARFQKADSNTGLTILKIPLSEVSQDTQESIIVAPLGNSYGIRQGEPVIAIGSPMGYSDSVAYGVATSVTNKIATVDTEYNLLTTDIMGNSQGSGILLNLDGEVVGIIAQSYALENSKNVITGLAISQTKELIEILSNNTDIPYIGIKGQDVTADISKRTGIPKGVGVLQTVADSPAMQAGIQSADVVISINGTDVETIRKYHEVLAKCKVGSTAKLKLMRKGAEGYVEIEVDVTVGAA